MAEPNDCLRRARECVESPNATGEPLSRQELAELVNAWVYKNTTPPRVIATDCNYVGQLERGRIRWPQDPDRRAGFRAVLNVSTDAELGFRRPRRSRSTVTGVDRQKFIRAALSTTAAAAVGGPFAFAELITPTQPTPVPSVVGHAHVTEIRNAAQAFHGWQSQYGGGLLREAAVAQLRHSAKLLNASCPESIQADLFSAVGEFAHVTGFMVFDDCAHDDARRTFQFALKCAEEAGDWHLRAKVIRSMARQAIWCGDPDTGLTFIELAMVRADWLTATERAILHTERAWALAKLGRVQDAVSAVGLADEEFSHTRPVNDPVYVHYYNAGWHASCTGSALWDIAVGGYFIAEARQRLSNAVAGLGDEFARGRAMSQIQLASLVMATGDPGEAAAIGNQALDAVSVIRSRRAADDIWDLRRFAEPHARLTAVAELTYRIGSVVVV